jgi:hypothetical protein
VVRSLPHGNVAAVLTTVRQLKLDQILDPGPQRGRVLALVAERVLQPDSKLAAARTLWGESTHSTLGEELGLTAVGETIFAKPWTGWYRSSQGSRRRWPAAIWARAPWCFTTSARITSKGTAVHWSATVSRAMSSAVTRRWSWGYWPMRRAVRWRWRYSRATPLTPKPWPPRSASCANALG